MGLFDKWRERKRREKAAENGKSTNMWKRMFDRKKTRRKKKNESGTMGKPEVNMWGEPINPNYPKKTKQIIKNITTNKYDEIARRKYNKDYKDLNKLQQRSVRRRSERLAKRSLFGKKSMDKRKRKLLLKKRKRKMRNNNNQGDGNYQI